MLLEIVKTTSEPFFTFSKLPFEMMIDLMFMKGSLCSRASQNKFQEAGTGGSASNPSHLDGYNV
jgi:hypothetical protein